MVIMDVSFPAKLNKVINRATSRPEPTLHIGEQFAEFKERDKTTIDRPFYGFTDATCQCNRAIIGRMCWIFTRLRNRNDNCFPPIRRKLTRNQGINFIIIII